MMKIEKNKVLEQNIDFFWKYLDMKQYSYLLSNREHYRLLTYLSLTNDNINIIDAGTCNGHSCLSLAQNKKNKVITYDILDKHFDFFDDYKNIEFKKLDINLEKSKIIKSANIIFLDIDPHDGIQETNFTNYLDKIGYKGYLVCDDINLNNEMKTWWDSITHEKHDISSIGHHSGTGIINFNTENIEILD